MLFLYVFIICVLLYVHIGRKKHTVEGALLPKTKVKIGVSHHQSDGGDWKCEKPLVFVLDEPLNEAVKTEKGKKKKKVVPQVTAKNFGGHLNISKIKDAEMLLLAWRCRFLDAHMCREKFPLLLL